MSAATWIAAAALGGCGALARFLLDGIVAGRAGRDFPFGTLVVNATGAILLGLIVGAAVKGDEAILVGTAAIGSYTTFSTWMLETHRLVEEGELGDAFANVAVSMVLGLGAAALGRHLGGGL
jgi:CrcB protein